MARGDVRSTRRGGGGGGGGDYYDDEGRGMSLYAWERFQDSWSDAGHSRQWLTEMPDEDCHWYYTNSTHRYRLEDIATMHASTDSRAKRLVIQKHDESTWNVFHRHLIEGMGRHREHLNATRQERNEAWKNDLEAQRLEREAEAAIVELKDLNEIRNEIELVAGVIRSDFDEAIQMKEVHDRDEGEWLDDPVQAYQTGYGFGDEIKSRHGVKLQVTVSLDLSNSMYYNRVHVVAANAFRQIGMTLEELRKENESDIYTAYFTFSDDHSWDGTRGREVRRLQDSEGSFNYFGFVRPSTVESWYGTGPFSGEDTYLAPLFDALETWEDKYSDPGCARLDIVITDAVLEHPKDIRLSSEIQANRDGNLQTIFLNFMPEEEWLGSTLPLRCVQYPANADNIGGLLRTVLAEFLAVYI